MRLHGKSETSPCEDSERDPVLFLEDVLAASAAACGMPVQRMSVPQAKALLKQHFGDVGRQLASRIGRASQLRNAKAHPDRSLLQAILSLQPSDMLDTVEPAYLSEEVDEPELAPQQPGLAVVQRLGERLDVVECRLRRLELHLEPDALSLWLAEGVTKQGGGTVETCFGFDAGGWDLADPGIVSDTGERPCSLAVGVAWADVVDSDSEVSAADRVPFIYLGVIGASRGAPGPRGWSLQAVKAIR